MKTRTRLPDANCRLDSLRADPLMHVCEVRGVINAKSQNRVTVVAVLPLKDPLARDHLVIELVGVCKNINLPVCIPGQTQKDDQRDEGPDQEEVERFSVSQLSAPPFAVLIPTS